MNPSTTNQNEDQTHQEMIKVLEEKVEQLKQCLPKTNFMGSNLEMVNYQGFWCRSRNLNNFLHYQTHFRARNTDVFLASQPKTGTTWLISLLYSIVNRVNHPPKQSPLLNHNPHELVYHLENGIYVGNPIFPRPDQLDELPSPLLFYTHFPYPSLPESIKSLPCKILYIARNPLDTCVSQWHWHSNLLKSTAGDEIFLPPSLEDYFEEFCEGRFPYGPYFEHVIGYWNMSIERPNKVLFLKYEDLKGDNSTFHLKRLAEFVGLPFSLKEENDGVINDIMELCSINNLKELEVNKTGFMNKFVEKKDYFRKGEVGDWTNHFSPSMVEKANTLMKQKLEGKGLSFQLLPK